MRKDYHMHPMIIQNEEAFAQFVEEALNKGIDEICITDHMPMQGSAAKDRIPSGQVEVYCERVRNLAQRYAGQLRIKLGIEIDYHPSLIDEIEKVLSQGQFDYILGSSHLHAMPACNYFASQMTRSEYAYAMYENTIRAANSGYFDAIPHLDMYRWIYSQPNRFSLVEDEFDISQHMEIVEQTLRAIKNNNLYLEINPHYAMATQNVSDTYPQALIVEKALDMGIKFSYGSDAHCSSHVGAMLDELHLHPTYARALAKWESEEI